MEGSGQFRSIYGVDFSGAVDAGRKIWIAECTASDSALTVEDCWPLARETSIKERDACLCYLVELIRKTQSSLFGLDFPFSLPNGVLKTPHENGSWEDLVASFADFKTPDEFKAACCATTCGKELRRKTDSAASSPFSPYNRRLYKQTYYGIRNLLGPLVRDNAARILPMQSHDQGLPCIIEICPASTLKSENLYIPYKGRKWQGNRREILNRLQSRHQFRLPPEMDARILGDQAGDALDSVIAALATYKASLNGFTTDGRESDYKIEGYIFR